MPHIWRVLARGDVFAAVFFVMGGLRPGRGSHFSGPLFFLLVLCKKLLTAKLCFVRLRPNVFCFYLAADFARIAPLCDAGCRKGVAF